jgi:hypothetical protein
MMYILLSSCCFSCLMFMLVKICISDYKQSEVTSECRNIGGLYLIIYKNLKTSLIILLL